MSEEFKTFIDYYLADLRKRYYLALSSFYLYDRFRELAAPNVVGQEKAVENVKILNRFGSFFLVSKEALRICFLLELAKIFDDHRLSLHIEKLIWFYSANIERFSKNDFIEFNENREFMKGLAETYKGVDEADLTNIKIKLEGNKGIINRLVGYRNQQLCHSDIERSEIDLNREEIITLLKFIEEFLNLFSSRLNSSTTLYDRVEEECKNNLDYVIEYLIRFEPYRLAEIRKRYGLPDDLIV